ncbi:Lst7p NDAI_0D04140 [Naumovozyma dairenensis CBS 421]|uniref:UDENN FLCN/SMCR8-type domain-containing protein n=1 Tax=Naumovozyma dairenensis (strain ATCC 10597 / BCRC 20456 / CBS 421 / NBRC 0211 / NRRL Y-12639) TaxID=1071378 RepID=G0WAB7_NAUDC|nr:hypothetical protein NDAI_0D04140 [Naumovozyma dairenensis CBS 421]CCD24728.1 hypothetical protein NDAI_0D04140 [Naumovozyma dairenensis CBS 421]
MDNILISLAHFCDKHGPRILLVTQSSQNGARSDDLLLPDYPIDSYCESCLLHFPQGNETIRSMRSTLDEKCYVTTQYSSIRYQLMNSIIRRCFSEETMVYDNMPLVFYDQLRGLNLIMGFKLYDANARGNERRYCFILTIDSKDSDAAMKILSNNWNFIIGGFFKMINHINESHNKELKNQSNERDHTNGLSPLMSNYLRGNKSKLAKNLVELTNDKNIFLKMHKWNTYLLNMLITNASPK